ncbi:MAG: DUF1801 domain-containing protein [Promethearchaeota archaeon]
MCYIQKNPNQHVRIGFFKGVKLYDPDNILEGKDGEKKYVLITDINDITEKKIENFLKIAAKLI